MIIVDRRRRGYSTKSLGVHYSNDREEDGKEGYRELIR